MSYFEIYCERVKDLLNPENNGYLKVREKPVLGPYVDGLKKIPVMNYKHIDDLMEIAYLARARASTKMGRKSSEVHDVFTLILTQKWRMKDLVSWGEKVCSFNN